MPELPEVETSCNGISPHCLGQVIQRIEVRQPSLRWPVDPHISEKLSGQKIITVKRRAKYIVLQTQIGDLLIHLGMSGSLRVVKPETELKKHDHIDLWLANGKAIRYHDPRRFGCIVLNEIGEQHPLLNNLGVEPLGEAFNPDYLYAISQKRRVAIKSLIMNGQVVVGVGNIYAQEALFRARINPNRAANNISKSRIKALVESIKQVLAEAIEAGGSSLKDFTSADGKPGYFQQTLQVYGRGGEDCVICHHALKSKAINQRATVYCVHCQK